MPKKNRKVNHASFILNRRHAEMCVNDSKITDIICSYPIDSEAWPSSLLSVNNCLEEVDNRLIAFVDWNRSEGNGNHPYQFRQFNQKDFDLLLKAKADGCLFARKFAASFPDSVFYELLK